MTNLYVNKITLHSLQTAKLQTTPNNRRWQHPPTSAFSRAAERPSNSVRIRRSMAHTSCAVPRSTRNASCGGSTHRVSSPESHAVSRVANTRLTQPTSGGVVARSATSAFAVSQPTPAYQTLYSSRVSTLQ